ncbi:hypothetical protein [Clostridium paraputrificum]|uniref:histidine kinase n=1 Tax=Clostridium paraputrificum TaxID=29363 RepID=A0A6N3CBG8_9CLOT
MLHRIKSIEYQENNNNKYKESLFVTIPILISILLNCFVKCDYNLYRVLIEIFCASMGAALFLVCIIRKDKKVNYYFYIGVGFFFLSIFSFIHAVLLNSSVINVSESINNIFVFSSYCLSYILIILSFGLDKKKSKLIDSIRKYILVSISILLVNMYCTTKKSYLGSSIEFERIIILIILVLITFSSINKNKDRLNVNEKNYLYAYLILLIFSQVIDFFNEFYEFTLGFEVGIFKYSSYCIMFAAISRFVLYKSYHDIEMDLEKAQKRQVDLNRRLSERNKLLIECKSQIEKSEKKYGKLINTIKDGIIIFYFDRLSYINKGALQILDYNEDAYVTGRRLEYVLKDLMPLTSFRFDNNGNVILDEYIKIENIIKKDKEYEIYLLKMDKYNRLLYVKDNTEINRNRKIRKEYEEYLKEESLKNEFYSNISHELRTPINLIYSALQLNEINLEEESIEPLMARNKIIRQNCLRLIRTINNFIDTNRISEGFLKPNMKVYNIVSVIENISMECTSYFEKIDGTITFDSVEEEIYVECDKDMMERIMLNLLSNSVKHGKRRGKVYIYIEEDEDIVLIHVSNNGYVIDKSIQPYIYDKFTKINKSLNREREGSGLGLFLVKALLELQGGVIELKSNSKVGSEFIIKLPKSYEEENVEYKHEMVAIKEKVDMEFSDIYL